MNKVRKQPNQTSETRTDIILEECENDMVRRVHQDSPSLEHLESGGSRTRARICIHAGIKLSLRKHDIICLASAIELLHNASLIHDDIQDQEPLRRDKASLWKRYGTGRAICSGDAMIAAAFGTLADLSATAKISEVLRLTQQAVAETIEGQALDIEADNAIASTQYETIAAMKSGPLFRLALSLPLQVANRSDLIEKVEYIAAKFAIAYQINDDLNDWQHDKQNNDLNLVNILSEELGIEKALDVAKNRAKYLLLKCQQELTEFPNDSAQYVLSITSKLLAQVENHD